MNIYVNLECFATLQYVNEEFLPFDGIGLIFIRV